MVRGLRQLRLWMLHFNGLLEDERFAVIWSSPVVHPVRRIVIGDSLYTARARDTSFYAGALQFKRQNHRNHEVPLPTRARDCSFRLHLGF